MLLEKAVNRLRSNAYFLSCPGYVSVESLEQDVYITFLESLYPYLLSLFIGQIRSKGAVVFTAQIGRKISGSQHITLGQ